MQGDDRARAEGPGSGRGGSPAFSSLSSPPHSLLPVGKKKKKKKKKKAQKLASRRFSLLHRWDARMAPAESCLSAGLGTTGMGTEVGLLPRHILSTLPAPSSQGRRVMDVPSNGLFVQYPQRYLQGQREEDTPRVSRPSRGWRWTRPQCRDCGHTGLWTRRGDQPIPRGAGGRANPGGG
ncbi:unnamed protein product [Pipistrellus nathusii]|uniref:Uncharacterized protein n=1 Tax=Pipistrellus nathusii TaxID=59473 RepID=A0ABN9ZR85_PIPNA